MREGSLGGLWGGPRREAVEAWQGSCTPTFLLCLWLNPCIRGVWAQGPGEECLAKSGHPGNKLLSLLHSDMKSERRTPSPDVIVLSDSEQPASPRVNGLMKETLKETSTEALMVSLVPMLGENLPSGTPK